MMVEMNVAVASGCLLGVQPVLAKIFPRLFARSYHSGKFLPPHTRQEESGYPESFEAYPLSNLSGKAHDKKVDEGGAFETLWAPEGRGLSFAGASSSGRKRGASFAPGVITVDKEVMVQREVTPCRSPTSELGGKLHFITNLDSEDWTPDDLCLKD